MRHDFAGELDRVGGCLRRMAGCSACFDGEFAGQDEVGPKRLASVRNLVGRRVGAADKRHFVAIRVIMVAVQNREPASLRQVDQQLVM